MVCIISEFFVAERELDDEFFGKEKDFQSTSSSSNSDTNESCSKSPIRDNILDLVSLDEHSIGKSFVTGSPAPTNLQQEFSTTINIPNVQILKVKIIRENDSVLHSFSCSYDILFFRPMSSDVFAVPWPSVIIKRYHC